MSRQVSRRQFLRGTAAAAGLGLASQAFSPPNILAQRSPNSKLNVAVIGCANQGVPALNAAATENLVALVDVDENHLATAHNWLKEYAPDVDTAKLKIFHDYRKMFDGISQEIDVVFAAVPDHHHYLTAMIAMSLGKHVYVEKPLAHSISEVRQMTAAAKKYKVVTQLGNQGHSMEHIRRLCEYIWAGAIGNVLETYSWARSGRGGVGGRLPTKPVPAGLHWDEWIGPAPFRDYHDELHPLLWRSWWDFGTGSLGDWGCHNLDGPFMALKLDQSAPTSVEVLVQNGGSDERFPLQNIIRWNYPARGGQPPVKVYWYDGYFDKPDPNRTDDEGKPLRLQNRPPIVLELEKKYGRDLKAGGTVFVGDKGILACGDYAGSPRMIPEEAHRAFRPPAKTLPRVKGRTHQLDFLLACKEGYQPASHFGYGGPLTEMALLGCLAIRAGVGQKVEWDPVAMKCTNVPEVNSLIQREYRPGWSI
jgi:predicted dehydrogenase